MVEIESNLKSIKVSSQNLDKEVRINGEGMKKILVKFKNEKLYRESDYKNFIA